MPELRVFNPETATEDYYKKRIAFLNTKRKEDAPDDPPTTLEASIQQAKGWKLIESMQIEAWDLWLDDAIVAELFLTIDSDENNNHLLEFQLHVLTPYRRKGYAKLLLPKLIAFATKHKRSLVQSHTSSRIPAGHGFAEHIKARASYNGIVSQLVLETLNPTLLNDWLAIATVVGNDFEMGFWGNTFPEDELQAIAEMIDVMNSAPTEDLDINDWKTKPEELREHEAYRKARADERRVLYLRHKASGELAGYTETVWEPETPAILHQNDTGVLPKYRGSGLGKWLKAAMVEKITTERPTVTSIRTDNAASNTSMLSINDAMGFELYESRIVWQLEVEKIKAYLQK